jgi:phage baseplate assembly protein W
MFGYAPKLPLKPTADDGKYGLTKTINETVAQNLKNLVLTCPGERIMDPDFGVGLKLFLFEMNDNTTAGLIAERIQTQASLYMPNLTIENINFVLPKEDRGELTPLYAPRDQVDGNLLGIEIDYSIRGAGDMTKRIFIPAEDLTSATAGGY